VKNERELLAVGARIQERRKALGIQQGELADRIGILASELSDLERGLRNCGIGRLRAIAVALKCSTDWLLLIPGAPKPSKPTRRGPRK
jgi:transcriptional regulator with XRE-family HTH domain